MSLRALFASLRPHQWTKNLVLFAALVLSKHLFESGPFERTVFAFALFCALSGTVYLVNDLVDVERDRLHPSKRQRPIASGALSRGGALGFALGLGLASLVGAFALGAQFGSAAAIYLVLNLAYSFKLKEVVVVDVLSVSAGFVLRAIAGAVVIGVHISDWLLICTFLFALFLILCKRRAEITTLSENASEHRRILAEYSPYLLDQMISVVTASCVTAYAFYTTARETVDKFQTDRLVWTFPFVLYGIFRYLYLVHQKEQGGSPTDILLTDRPLLLDVGLWAAAIVWIVYSAQGLPMPLRGHP